MEILAISGSIRSRSSNKAVVSALKLLAPDGVTINVYQHLAELPHFNPDLDKEPLPEPVADFLGQLRKADGVVICSPEYAHGVAGVMKNAIDWTVGSGGLVDKPIALINASPRSTYAQAHLSETLGLLGILVDKACVSVPVAGSGLDTEGVANHPETASALNGALEELMLVINETSGGQPDLHGPE